MKISSICLLMYLYACSVYADSTAWRTLAPGLDYVALHPTVNIFHGTLHAFRIDLNTYQINLLSADEFQQTTDTIDKFVAARHALIGINGGFFTPDAKPLGLRVKNAVITNPAKPVSWWGIFYIAHNKAHITTYSNFNMNKNITFAIQSGPRLIVASHLPALKPNIDNRSALGITRDGKVIIVVTEGMPLSTQQLANIMLLPSAQGGLDCTDALNLDGGTSTQLYANINNFKVDVPGYKSVADAIIVGPKQAAGINQLP